MNSSGIKRGLAVSAISALALAGLAIAPAQADTIRENEDLPLELYSQTSGDISIRDDGNNTTVTLAAGSNDVNVNAFRFSADIGGVFTTIATVANVNGYGTAQWTPPSGADLNAITTVRVEALNNANVPLYTQDRAVDVDNAATNDAVGLVGAPRSPLGEYDGSAIVKGLTTDVANTTFDIGGPQSNGGDAAAVATGPVSTLTPVAAVVPVGANDTADATDEVIARGFVTGESDDVQIYNLYDQVITTVTSTVTPGYSANVAGPATQTRYDITTKDQNGNPIAGVDVFEADANGANMAAIAGMGLTPGGANYDDSETGVVGTTTIRLNESEIDGIRDNDATANVGATYVVVDYNQDGDFDNGLDKLFKLTISNLPIAPATIAITSSLGNVMDDDESTNLQFLVKDAGGTPVPDATVTYTISRNVDDNTPADSTTAPAMGDTNAAGILTVSGVQLGINNEDVAVTVNATSGGATGTLAVETGESDFVWENGPSSQALAGTSKVEMATLELDSGSVLPNRQVQVDLIRTGDANGPDVPGATAGNMILSPQAEQPAGTIRGGDLIATATTDAAGKFGVKVTDPALPAGEELNDILRARGIAPNNDATQDLDLDWLRSLTPVRVNVYQDSVGTDDSDGLPSALGGALIPGGLGIGHVSAFNADDVLLTDVDIAVTIDEGFFVDFDNLFEATPAPGAPVDFASIGKSITVNTSDLNGLFLANIERHEGFDDNGEVDDKVRASVASVSDTHDLTWTTQAIPLNPRATNPLVVELSADQDSSILPKARAGNGPAAQEVNYDVFAYDQFGNPVSQDLDVTDNSPVADFYHPNGDDSQYSLSQPALVAYSPSTATQALEVELDGAVKTVYVDNVLTNDFDPANPDANTSSVPVDIEKTTAPINWYVVDLANSVFTLDSDTTGAVPVGTVVTVVLTGTDQEGQFLNDYQAQFLRTGPGDDDDDTNETPVQQADVNGKVYYDFVGSQAGTAAVTAVVYDDLGKRIKTVGPKNFQFGAGTGTVKPARVVARIKAPNNGGKDDRITVLSKPIAANAAVKLWKVKANGKKSVVARGRLGADGRIVFVRADNDGRGFTKYFATIAGTKITKAARSNTRLVR